MFDLFFRSSFDPSVQFIASSGYRGPVCPAGHRLCARTYVMPGWHCDSCEQDLDSGNTGQHCKVCASTCYALGYIMLVTLFTFDTQHLTCLSQFCDFDLCDACCELETVADPPLLKKMPSPDSFLRLHPHLAVHLLCPQLPMKLSMFLRTSPLHPRKFTLFLSGVQLSCKRKLTRCDFMLSQDNRTDRYLPLVEQPVEQPVASD